MTLQDIFAAGHPRAIAFHGAHSLIATRQPDDQVLVSTHDGSGYLTQHTALSSTRPYTIADLSARAAQAGFTTWAPYTPTA